MSLFKSLLRIRMAAFLCLTTLLVACSTPVKLTQPLPNQSTVALNTQLGTPILVLYQPNTRFATIKQLFPPSTQGVMQFSQKLPIIHVDHMLNNMIAEQLRGQGYPVRLLTPSTPKQAIQSLPSTVPYLVMIQPYPQYIPQTADAPKLNTLKGFGMIYNYREKKTYFFVAYQITVWDTIQGIKLAQANFLQSTVSPAAPAQPVYWPTNYAQAPYQQVVALRDWLNSTVIPVILAQIQDMMAFGSLSS